MEESNILEYKNFGLFYMNLYNRLFELIDLIIDENQYNIKKVKYSMLDFMDSYSYYILKKKLIEREEAEESTQKLFNTLKSFDTFTKSLNSYPSDDYIKIQSELKTNNFVLNKLTKTQYNYLLKEYYLFFEDLLIILKNFIDISSVSGFLPNIKSKTSLKSIGYANYNLFFTKLEDLKIKLSENTTNINLYSIFKSRRCIYSILVVFSPYFKDLELYEQLVSSLDFEFINDEKIMSDIFSSMNYKNLLDIPKELKHKLDDHILINLKKNISIIKRFISYQFGERDMSPKIKKKYAYDPTDT